MCGFSGGARGKERGIWLWGESRGDEGLRIGGFLYVVRQKV